MFKRQNQRIQAQGNIKTAISLVCVRCLEQFELKIHSRFDIILFPKEMVEQRSAALDEEDLEYIFYENDQIDLEKILVEQVNLFIPFKPVCKLRLQGHLPRLRRQPEPQRLPLRPSKERNKIPV